MSCTEPFVRFVSFMAAMLICEAVTVAAQDNDTLQQSRIAWNDFLSKNCPTGQMEKAVRKVMDGKYRDVGSARANDESHRLLFLIDDYHQVEFGIDRDSKLLLTPTIEPKGQWVRFPSGEVLSIPNPEEVKLKTKAEAAAIQYITQHTSHLRDSLSAVCKRSAKTHTWDAVVTINSLEADTPTYLLEVTDGGQINETRSISKGN